MPEVTSSLVETVYADLRLQLQMSAIMPSQKLVDTEISARYGISRMPAREALLRLVSEGYLIGTTRGFTIRELSLEDISGLFEVRRQLEPRAAASAARDMSDEVEARMIAAMAQVQAAFALGDIPALLAANRDFRNGWLGAVRNPHMAETIARFIDYFQSVRLGTFADPALASQYIDGLSRIHLAFLARDPLAVQERMMLFMFAAEEAYLAVRRRQIDDAAQPQTNRRKIKKKGTA